MNWERVEVNDMEIISIPIKHVICYLDKTQDFYLPIEEK